MTAGHDFVLWLCIVSFICIGKGAHMSCDKQQLDGVFSSLALLQLASPLPLSEHSLSLHKKPQTHCGCVVASVGTKHRAPSSPRSRTDAVSCPILQVTMSPVPGSPKVRLKFLAGGLGGTQKQTFCPLRQLCVVRAWC